MFLAEIEETKTRLSLLLEQRENIAELSLIKLLSTSSYYTSN